MQRKESTMGAGETALAALAEDPASVPSTHMRLAAFIHPDSWDLMLSSDLYGY